MSITNKRFSKFVFALLIAVLVASFFAYQAVAAQVNQCNGVEGAYGYVYYPERNVSICYDGDKSGQWQTEGFVPGSFLTTVWSHILISINS